jgi:transketolase
MKTINEIKAVTMDTICNAKSGHPGMALSSAPILYTLYNRFITAYPKKSKWINRDRFVLASGHASSLLYNILHLCGYNISLDDLKSFRKLNSLTPGHPECDVTDGVDATSGPLGQGIPMGVGSAIAERKLASLFNKEDLKIFDHYTYVLCGDGDMQEGVTQEAISLAGNLKLNKLIVIYDANDVTLDGPLSNSFSEDVAKRFDACGFNVINIENSEPYSVGKAINEAKKSDQPSLIIVKTIIGEGSRYQGTCKVHGAPLDEEDLKELKNKLEISTTFEYSAEAYKDFEDNFIKRGKKEYSKWSKDLNIYKVKYPDDYALLMKCLNKEIDFSALDAYENVVDKEISTRNASKIMLNLLADSNRCLIGGSADVAKSVMTNIDGSTHISKESFDGQIINYGIREFAMGSINNGILLHGGLNVFGGSFLVFSDYMKPSLRMASLMHLNNVYLFSHDSIAVGEDGPTHEPIEQLAMLRSIPNFNVIRPCNECETKWAYKVAFNSNNPVALILTRQNLKTKHLCEEIDFNKGAYFVKYNRDSKYTIIASGSEVNLALDVYDKLKEENVLVNVVSMPSWHMFEKQSKKYQKSILCTPYNKTITLEMLSTMGWSKYGKYNIGLDAFGKSAKASDVIKDMGFDFDGVYEKIRKIVS